MRRYVFRLVLLSCAVLGMSPARGDDQQIAQQILTRLQAEKQAGTLKGFAIDLQVDDGTVWLSGRVASSEQQAKALDLARRVAGVKQVVDDLTIAAPAPKNVASRQAPTPAQGPTPAGPAPQFVEMPTAPQAQVANAVPMVQAVPMTQQAAPQETANQVAARPSASTSSRKSASSSSSMLNSVSKSLTNVVSGNRQEEPQPVSHNSVQPASVSGDVSAAIGGPVGSGVDPSAASSRRGALMAAQPIAAAPQMVAPAEGLQPLNPTRPQMAAMVPVPYMMPYYPYPPQPQMPLPIGAARAVNYTQPVPMPAYGPVAGPAVPADGGAAAAPVPMYMPGSGVGIAPARYDHPTMPGYAWPSYACYPNYAAVTYPKQYSPTAWPYIGPFYPYPQVPLGWRKVTLEWDDGWWMLDFKDRRSMYNH